MQGTPFHPQYYPALTFIRSVPFFTYPGFPAVSVDAARQPA